MNNPSVILLVKFKSALTLDEVRAVVNSRKDDFRVLKGLHQKYYLQEPSTGEFAGLYLWESMEDFNSYKDSELRKTIASAYKTIGEPRIEVYKTIDVLRD